MQRMGTRLKRLAGSGPCLSFPSLAFLSLLRFYFALLVSPLFASLPLVLISSHKPHKLPHCPLSIPLVNQSP